MEFSDLAATTTILGLLVWGLWQRLIIIRMRRRQSLGVERDAAVKRTQAERQGMLDLIPDAFLMVDSNDLICDCNAAARRLLGPGSLLDRPVVEVLRDTRLAAPYFRCRESQDAVASDVHLPAEAAFHPVVDGEAMDSAWHIEAAPLLQADGARMISLLLRDRSAEYHAEQIRKDFVANASHELRTPITLIDGYLETFLDAPEMLEDRSGALRILGIMRKHTLRIARLIEDMLLISRIESGAAAGLVRDEFLLADCVADVLERLESVIVSQGARIVTRFHEPVMTVHGDRFYWTQVMFNLIENALKQNAQPGLEITITGERTRHGVVIEVIDNGIGIPAADVPYIFKRFYRVEKHHSQNDVKGTGLGLSIVKRTVEAHGGTISCQSTPGIRTCFHIELKDEG